MAKDQKKPTMQSMGGVLPRRPQVIRPLENIKAVIPIKETQKNTEPKQKKVRKKRKLRIGAKLSWIKSKIFYLIVPAFVAGLYLYDINHFPPLSYDDNPALSQGSLSGIDSIEFLPMKVLAVLMEKLNQAGHTELRLLSVSVMLFSIFCFYKVISSWISKRMSVIAVLLFASSSWALFQARQDNPSVMMFGLIPVLLYAGNLIINSASRLVRIISSLLLIQFIFVPGAIWFFVLLGLVLLPFYKKDVGLRPLILPLSVMILVILAYIGLIMHLSLDSPAQFARLGGVEIGSLPTWEAVRTNIVDLPSQLFLNGLNDSSMWLRATPIIDLVSSVLLITGVIQLVKSKTHPIRRSIMFVFLLLSLALIFINGPGFISVILPLVYLTAALGITYLTDQWMIIFPNNPLPRSLGLILVCLIVAVICGYHIERYFIGWPKTDEYHQIFKG